MSSSRARVTKNSKARTFEIQYYGWNGKLEVAVIKGCKFRYTNNLYTVLDENNVIVFQTQFECFVSLKQKDGINEQRKVGGSVVPLSGQSHRKT